MLKVSAACLLCRFGAQTFCEIGQPIKITYDFSWKKPTEAPELLSRLQGGSSVTFLTLSISPCSDFNTGASSRTNQPGEASQPSHLGHAVDLPCAVVEAKAVVEAVAENPEERTPKLLPKAQKI